VTYTDETLSCADCGAPFTFTAGEQEFHASKGFTNKPGRCPTCRAARRAQRDGGSYGGGSYGGQREMFTATCASCGNEARVPFQPRGDKPVYCSDCFRSQGGGGDRSGSYSGGSRGSRW
jgi:CxxC-x17-CxxC domain-containing protein